MPNRGEGLLPADHPYACDIDLIGPGSLFQRIDVTHTVHGEHALAEWLGRAAAPAAIRARQAAVTELAAMVELRQELEAARSPRARRREARRPSSDTVLAAAAAGRQLRIARDRLVREVHLHLRQERHGGEEGVLTDEALGAGPDGDGAGAPLRWSCA